MPDLSQLQTWLTEAEAARHQLLIGKSVATVNYEGKGQVSYSKTDFDKLDAYISSLRSQIAALTDSSGRARPIQLTF